MLHTYIYWINTSRTQEDFFSNILTSLTLLQGFGRVVEGLHMRGCWRLNINFIF